MRTLWITNIPSPSRVKFFNELGKTCELTVLFEMRGSPARHKSWLEIDCRNFAPIFMRSIRYSTHSAFTLEVIKHLRARKYDAIVITNFSSVTGVIAIAYLRAIGRPYYLESDGGSPSSGRIKSWIKKRTIWGAKGYLSASRESDRYFATYGADPGLLIRYPFTSVNAGQVLQKPPTPEQRRKAKSAIGISQPNMILSVGRFIRLKGIDVLIEAFSRQAPNVSLCIVGGTATEEYEHLVQAHQLQNVHFVEFQDPEDLEQYFMAADLFVLPTRRDAWGLVINEALARAVPVITTDRCVAGLEMVEPNDCGLVVPADDAAALADAIERLLRDTDLRALMAVQALRVSADYTIEEMAKRHEEILGGFTAHD